MPCRLSKPSIRKLALVVPSYLTSLVGFHGDTVLIRDVGPRQQSALPVAKVIKGAARGCQSTHSA
jgi:hypothetical protein